MQIGFIGIPRGNAGSAWRTSIWGYFGVQTAYRTRTDVMHEHVKGGRNIAPGHGSKVVSGFIALPRPFRWCGFVDHWCCFRLHRGYQFVADRRHKERIEQTRTTMTAATMKLMTLALVVLIGSSHGGCPPFQTPP
jgi:hypothetical protein